MLNLVSCVVVNALVVLTTVIRAFVAQLIIGLVVGILIVTMSNSAQAAEISLIQEPSWMLYLGIMLLIGGTCSIWCSIKEELEWEVTIGIIVISIVMIIIGL